MPGGACAKLGAAPPVTAESAIRRSAGSRSDLTLQTPATPRSQGSKIRKATQPNGIVAITAPDSHSLSGTLILFQVHGLPVKARAERPTTKPPQTSSQVCCVMHIRATPSATATAPRINSTTIALDGRDSGSPRNNSRLNPP